MASILTLSAIMGAWVFLGLPQVASQTYVDNKFKPVEEIRTQLNATRIQINRMTRQSLEAEKYRLTTESKTNNSFDIIRRMKDIDEELSDTAREREILLKRN